MESSRECLVSTVFNVVNLREKFSPGPGFEPVFF